MIHKLSFEEIRDSFPPSRWNELKNHILTTKNESVVSLNTWMREEMNIDLDLRIHILDLVYRSDDIKDVLKEAAEDHGDYC